MKKHYKLSLIGKIIILVGILLFVGIVAIATMFVRKFIKTNQINSQSSVTAFESDSYQNLAQTGEDGSAEQITDSVQARGYCNSFAGYTAAIVANGGNTTQAGSYFDQAGINVTINIEDNDDVIIEDFKNGKIDFFYMTVNKMPMVSKELEDAGIEIIIPYLTDTSTGGDGIVATSDYGSIMDLQNAKIAVARNSVSQAIPVYLFNRTNLDTNSLLGNFVEYDSTGEAVDAFLRGEVDAVSTWDMSTASKAEDSKILFTTADGENLVIDALVVNKKFATENPDVVTKIIDGTIAVVNDMNNGINVEQAYDTIRASIPDFANYDDTDMQEAINASKYLNYRQNLETFSVAQSIYSSFGEVWKQLGFEIDVSNVAELFDDSYLKSLESKWNNEKVVEETEVVATEEMLDNKEELLSKSAQILFNANTAELLTGYDENYVLLDEFVEIAKVFNRTVIMIEGNVSLTPGNSTTEADIVLSEMRAETVKQYLVENGIDAGRIVVKGNGGDNPIADNNTAEGRKLNRRVDLKIYKGESDN